MALLSSWLTTRPGDSQDALTQKVTFVLNVWPRFYSPELNSLRQTDNYCTEFIRFPDTPQPLLLGRAGDGRGQSEHPSLESVLCLPQCRVSTCATTLASGLLA